jgi:hypothetical protein
MSGADLETGPRLTVFRLGEINELVLPVARLVRYRGECLDYLELLLSLQWRGFSRMPRSPSTGVRSGWRL